MLVYFTNEGNKVYSTWNVYELRFERQDYIQQSVKVLQRATEFSKCRKIDVETMPCLVIEIKRLEIKFRKKVIASKWSMRWGRFARHKTLKNERNKYKDYLRYAHTQMLVHNWSMLSRFISSFAFLEKGLYWLLFLFSDFSVWHLPRKWTC